MNNSWIKIIHEFFRKNLEKNSGEKNSHSYNPEKNPAWGLATRVCHAQTPRNKSRNNFEENFEKKFGKKKLEKKFEKDSEKKFWGKFMTNSWIFHE